MQRVVAHPIAEAKDAIAGQLLPVDKRLGEIRAAVKDLKGEVKDLKEDVEEQHRRNVSFQASACEELAALRSGQDELRSAVQKIGEKLASAEGRLATAIRRLAGLYALLAVTLGLVVVLLVTT